MLKPKMTFTENGVTKLLQKELYEAMLEDELNHHLGYDKHAESPGDNYRNGYSDKTLKTQHGEIEVTVPRDRAGSFEPIMVAKHQLRATVIDDAVISLYSKGMSLSQIANHIEDLYQIEMSNEQLSTITEAVMEEVGKWQNRALSNIYPILTWRKLIKLRVNKRLAQEISINGGKNVKIDWSFVIVSW